jgi:DNA-binding Lrp family transcriptional regulator
LLIEAQMKILKFMSEMTARTDMNEFANKMGLTPNEILKDMQELAKEGFLKKIGGGYALTEKGKTALRAFTPVQENMRFQFYTGLGHSTGLSAGNVIEFRDAALKVDVTSLEFHLYRGDFETWFRTAINDEAFADELTTIRKTDLRGEELKKAIAKATNLKYNLE